MTGDSEVGHKSVTPFTESVVPMCRNPQEAIAECLTAALEGVREAAQGRGEYRVIANQQVAVMQV